MLCVYIEIHLMCVHWLYSMSLLNPLISSSGCFTDTWIVMPDANTVFLLPSQSLPLLLIFIGRLQSLEVPGQCWTELRTDILAFFPVLGENSQYFTMKYISYRFFIAFIRMRKLFCILSFLRFLLQVTVEFFQTLFLYLLQWPFGFLFWSVHTVN